MAPIAEGILYPSNHMNYELILSVLARGFTMTSTERAVVQEFMASSCGYCRRATVRGFCARHYLPTVIQEIWQSRGLISLSVPIVLSSLFSRSAT